MKTLLLFGLLIFAPQVLIAHMVTYKDGYTIASMAGPDFGLFKGAYTFHPRFAASFEHYRWLDTNEQQKQRGVFQLNSRLKRWNAPDSQGNIYAGVGYGEDETFAYQVEADWEDRQYYVWGSFRGLDSDAKANAGELGSGNQSIKKLRAGLAPYVVNADALHTWLILEYENNSFMSDRESLTPFIRLFYKNFLTELGYGFDNQFRFNFMIHM